MKRVIQDHALLTQYEPTGQDRSAAAGRCGFESRLGVACYPAMGYRVWWAGELATPDPGHRPYLEDQTMTEQLCPNQGEPPAAAGAEALAARPLLEQIAAMGDCIGQQTVGQIVVLSERAAAWLRENPPG